MFTIRDNTPIINDILEFENDLQVVIDTALRFGSADSRKLSGHAYMALAEAQAKAARDFRTKYSPK